MMAAWLWEKIVLSYHALCTFFSSLLSTSLEAFREISQKLEYFIPPYVRDLYIYVYTTEQFLS